MEDIECPTFDKELVTWENANPGASIEDGDTFVAANICSKRWYVVDGTGEPVYMLPQEEDKEVFANIDPLRFWHKNLGVDRL